MIGIIETWVDGPQRTAQPGRLPNVPAPGATVAVLKAGNEDHAEEGLHLLGSQVEVGLHQIVVVDRETLR